MDVGLEIVVVAGKHLAGASHAGLNFVNDQKDAVFVADAAQALQKFFRRGDVAAFALHDFDDDARDFFGRRRGLEETLLDPVETGAADCRGVGLFAGKGMAEDVRVRHMHHVERLPLEAFALRDF